MCDPLLIAGLALQAGSVVSNTVAANSDAQARATVLDNEIQRNQRLNQQAAQVNAHSVQAYQDFVPQQEQRAQQLGDYFNGSTPAKPNVATSGIMPTSSSDIVNTDEANQLAKADAFGTQQGQALGQLRSFGDLLADKSRIQAQDATQIGQIGNDMTGYATNVVPYQLDAASHSGDTARTVGDLLALGGTAAAGVGAYRNPGSLSFLYAPSVVRAGGAIPGGVLYPYAYGA